MKTQVRQIADSRIAYLVQLNKHCKKSLTSRYSIYLLRDNELKVLWPFDGINTRDKLLPLQVEWNHNYYYPCYHFVVSGGQVNHMHEVKRMLQKINPQIEVFGLNGWQPSYN